MLDKQNLYKDIFIRRFLNKFYFINTKELPYIASCQIEIHNIKQDKHNLTYFAFIEELLGFIPFFIKKGFHYNFEGKKIFTQDIKININEFNIILNFFKNLYLNLAKKELRKKLLKKIGKNSLNLTILCSSLSVPLYRELFILINTISFDLKFTIKNRFLISYFFRNFNFL